MAGGAEVGGMVGGAEEGKTAGRAVVVGGGGEKTSTSFFRVLLFLDFGGEAAGSSEIREMEELCLHSECLNRCILMLTKVNPSPRGSYT